MAIDMTINLGHVITLVGILITFITWGNGVKWQMNIVEVKLKTLEEEIKKITQLLITTSTLEIRISNLESRIDEHEHKSSDGRKPLKRLD